SAGTAAGKSLVGTPAGAKACGLEAAALPDAIDAPRPLAIGTAGSDIREALVLSAPILEGDRALGSLHALWTDDGPAETATATEAFRAFAGHAAMAITDASTVNELNHAFHDPLTGLPNRSLFLDRLEQASTRARRTGERVALLFIDLNGFKEVNDTLGHAEGDQVLRIIGGRISACTRGHESVGRLGGDEFAVLLEDATQESALEVANRVLVTLRGTTVALDGQASIGASIGIALTDNDCDTGDELLRRADIAMYNVKSTGESGAAVYRGHMGHSRMDHRATAAAFERALADGQFVVHYQPIVSLNSRVPVGVEALIRWRHPDRGLMEPAEFIPDVERSGMIVDVGRWVLLEVSKQCVRWRAASEHTRNLTVSVNLSGYQVLGSLATHLTDALDGSGLEPSALVLEVTESIFLGDFEAAGDCLNEARSLGVRLALDDFGTGYSSLSYIKRFPFEQLKIDRLFVRGLGGPANGVALVKTIVELGQRLGMTTIAEGIERPIELAQLRSMRCALGQGFLFSHPAEASAVTELLLLPPPAAAGVADVVAP
ncbi:MAG: EAL domain-containing protein, partial [Thermoleophilia bacterium]|nr:EAL domain-containing protein [Thermoleophilia bacterium]